MRNSLSDTDEAASKDPASGNSKKWMFILIGIALIAIIGIVIILLAVGIYFFTSSPRRTFDPPGNLNNRPASAPRTSGTPVTGPKDTTDALINAIRKKSEVGDYKLQNVVPSFSAPLFSSSIGEAKGVYSSANSTVNFTAAEFDGKGRAAVSLTQMVRKRSEAGAKILTKVKVDKTGANATFEQNGHHNYAYCTWQTDKAVLCHVINAPDEKTVQDFRRSLNSRQ